MPQSHKVLGQSAPSATTDTVLYTCPSSPSTQAVISSVVICNRAATAATYRIAIRVNAAALANSQYICFDASIPGNDSTVLTSGICCGPGDIVSVYASSANLSFSAFGVEVA